jgi:hypothetical protein
MRRGVLWILIVLGLPQVALAEGGTGSAAPIVPGGELAADADATSGAPSGRGLDLWLDPRQLPEWQEPQYDASGLESDWADSDTELDAADRGLSFGLEIKPRSRIGALARQDEPGDSGLGDQLEKLIERPVFELRGRYRF